MEKGDQKKLASMTEAEVKPSLAGDVEAQGARKDFVSKTRYVSGDGSSGVGAVGELATPKRMSSPFSNPRPDPSWNKSGMSDPVSRQEYSLPSVMRMGAQMMLHSHLAINLFRGRQGDQQRQVRPIIGLARFARQVALVWSAAETDDPYADQCLVDIEFKYNEAKAIFDVREKTLDEIIGGLEGLSVAIQTSAKPAAIDLQFFCPWSYQATLLLLQFDRIVRLGLTARHLGLIGDSEWDAVVSDSGRVLRHIFSLPNRWISTGVTREDCRKKTKVAKRALGLYAEVKEGRIDLSETVMSGEVRARLAPQNKPLEKYLASLDQSKVAP